MSNSTWDWWFGDDPTRYKSATMSGHSRRWFTWITRFVNRRRLFVFAVAIGASPIVYSTSLFANETNTDLNFYNASLGWASTASFAMIIADEEPTDAAESAAQKADPDKAAAEDKETLDEDEQRRKRLRDLLGDDEAPSKSEADDKKDTNKEKDDDEDDEDVFAEPFIENRLPDVTSGRFVLPPLRAVSIDQKPIGNGKVPEALNAGDELSLVVFPEDGYARSSLSNEAAWPSLIRPWAAPNTYSHPLYFEDRMLERHGHERWGCWQPLASGTRFFATLPMLPYLATVQEPCDIVYSKGYYRAGSPVPLLYQRPPLERRAVIVEAAVVSGTFIALP